MSFPRRLSSHFPPALAGRGRRGAADQTRRRTANKTLPRSIKITTIAFVAAHTLHSETGDHFRGTRRQSPSGAREREPIKRGREVAERPAGEEATRRGQWQAAGKKKSHGPREMM